MHDAANNSPCTIAATWARPPGAMIYPRHGFQQIPISYSPKNYPFVTIEYYKLLHGKDNPNNRGEGKIYIVRPVLLYPWLAKWYNWNQSD